MRPPMINSCGACVDSVERIVFPLEWWNIMWVIRPCKQQTHTSQVESMWFNVVINKPASLFIFIRKKSDDGIKITQRCKNVNRRRNGFVLIKFSWMIETYVFMGFGSDTLRSHNTRMPQMWLYLISGELLSVHSIEEFTRIFISEHAARTKQMEHSLKTSSTAKQYVHG